MRLIVVWMLTCVAVGCDVTIPQEVEPRAIESGGKVEFDSSACAEALARQAELANESPAFSASEVLDGILGQWVECGIPADFANRVRSACPFIGVNPPSDLSVEQVSTIRSVR